MAITDNLGSWHRQNHPLSREKTPVRRAPGPMQVAPGPVPKEADAAA